MTLNYAHIMDLITIKLITSNLFNYSTMLNKLIPIYNGSVLVSESALHDQSVMNALQSFADDNFEFKPIDSTSYYISDRD